jgi:hypothetical protein
LQTGSDAKPRDRSRMARDKATFAGVRTAR